MDLNDLYHRRGVSLMLAARATGQAARDAHRRFAAGYADRIRAAIRTNAAPAA
ncbi:hypothetical protein H9L13_00055 [Sphingomonas lutea]|uniref:Uncharacterized protein n=1 Tax=Sphingomonas lutea TaxID=1045317 RepID=A0A7G9SHT5_9SPHN|nr:hypothetical protein [Sphingomonas lutea]QNN67410.1 hypothetical protein H9L13_00055 [Sphingomonas lutea]